MADLPREVRRRYCKQCDELQVLIGDQDAHPCRLCGCVFFSPKPRPHVNPFGWCITAEDYTILRVQGIDPEVQDYEPR